MYNFTTSLGFLLLLCHIQNPEQEEKEKESQRRE